MDELKAKLLGSGWSASGKGRSWDRKNVESSPKESGRHAVVEIPAAFETSEDRVVNGFRRRTSRGRGSSRLRRLLLKRLAIALHSYGSSASRTEYLVEKAASKLEMDVKAAVFPALILLTFSDSDGEDATHVLKVESDLDVGKLGRVDKLANQLGIKGRDKVPLILAYWKLKTIATSPPTFSSWWWRLLGYTLSAPTSAMLFFNGNVYDGLLSLPLGLLVGSFDLLSTHWEKFGTLLNFVGALVISFIAKIFKFYLGKFNLCFESMVLGSLVQLLPGLTLTLGMSEMLTKAHIRGISRIMLALFSTLQLGFGIAMGENLLFWDSDSLNVDCQETDFGVWWSTLWFLLFSTSSLLLLKSRAEQWLGMICTSGVGYLVTKATLRLQLSTSVSSVFGAFSIGIASTILSHIHGDVPLVMTFSGILLLIPAGIGTKGIAGLLKDNLLLRMNLIFNLLIVGFSITLGLFLSKLVLPMAVFGPWKTSASNRATTLVA